MTVFSPGAPHPQFSTAFHMMLSGGEWTAPSALEPHTCQTGEHRTETITYKVSEKEEREWTEIGPSQLLTVTECPPWSLDLAWNRNTTSLLPSTSCWILNFPRLSIYTHTHTHGNNDYIIVCTTETELVSQRSRRSENVSYFHSLTTLNFRETSELERTDLQ